MGEEKVQIVATATDRASPALKALKKNVQSLGTNRAGPLGGVISGFAGISGPALVAGAAIGAFTGLLADGIAGALEEEKQLGRLDQALKNNVKGWDGNRASIDRYTDSAMDLAFSDDEARESLIKLLPAVKNVAKAQQLASLAMDISRGRNIDLGTATDIVIKANMGNVGALRRMGIELDKDATRTEILTQLQETYAGQADKYAESTAGKFESAQKKVDNAMEDAGHTIIETTAGFLSFSDAMKGDTEASSDFLHAVATLIPPVGLLADEVDRLREGMIPKNIIGPTKSPLVEAIFGSGGGTSPEDAFRSNIWGFGRQVKKDAKDVGEDIGEALGSGFSESLYDDMRSNKSFTKGLLHQITWTLNHPGKIQKEIDRLTDVLNGGKLQKLLTSDNPALRTIGQQIQDSLYGRLGGLTGAGNPPYEAGSKDAAAYAQGWNNNLPTLNSPNWPTPPGASRPPGPASRLPVMGAGGDLDPGESAIVGERGRAEVFTAGKHGGRVSPISGGGHGHNIILNGRVLGQAVDEYLGRQLSRTPSGVVSRG